MVRWLSQRPWSRAPKHASRFFADMMNPAPQTPHFVRPENRYCGRFAAPMRPRSHRVPCVLTRLRSGPEVVRHDPQLGTSRDIHSDVGFSRDTRFPVSGFFT